MNEADEIRQQMAQIRHDLHQDVSSVVSGVSGVVGEVSEVMDWRTIIAGHPYLLTGAAMAAGYLLVPRRKTRVEVVAQPRTFLGTQPAAVAPAPTSGGFRPLSWAFQLLTPVATHAIQAYALVWVENLIKQHLQGGMPMAGFDERSGRASGSDSHRDDQYRYTAPGYLR